MWFPRLRFCHCCSSLTSHDARFEREAKGREYDPTIAQLTLSFAAIHTTTELVTQVMTDVSANPEILDELRQEMVQVLRDNGWKKTSLYNMKLLDSVIKESLRIKPTGIGRRDHLPLAHHFTDANL